MADKKLNIQVRTKGAKKSKKDLKGVEGGMKSLGKSAAIAGAAFFGARGLITGFKKIIDLSAQQELAEKKLEASLGKVSQALLDQASALQQVSMFGDEQIIEAQALIAAFVKEEDAIAKATKATLDLAAAKGMDLTAAADLVSKTLGSSTNAMSRYGIAVEGAVGSTARLDSLVDNIAEKFGGQAKAQSDTLAGSMRSLSMAAGDLGEKLGDEFSEDIRKAADSMTFFIESINVESLKNGLSWWGKFIDRLNPGMADFTQKVNDLQAAHQKLLTDAPTESPFPTDEEMIGFMEIEGKVLEIRKESLTFLEPQPVIYTEINTNAKKLQELSAQTASSLLVSAVMGDNLGDSLKRAVLQMILMNAQAKIYAAVMASAKVASFLGGGGFLAGAASFLFGASPTQSSPSAGGASASKITINQNFGGMGVIDHNFAANSIIPAINKAVSTGQARIG